MGGNDKAGLLRQRGADQPLYTQVAVALRRELLVGRFQEAERLPSEAELVRLLGVSRPTVREALGVLEREGWIRRVQGVGTLVVRHRPIPVGHGQERLMSYTDYVAEYGRLPGTSHRRLRWERAGRRWGRILGIDPETPMALVERVRTADGEPVLLSMDCVPEPVIGAGFELEAMGESLFEYLRSQRGVTLAFSELVVRPLVAGRALAALLQMNPRRPALAIEEVYFGFVRVKAPQEPPAPLFWSLNIYRPSRWVLRFVRRA